MTASFKRGSVGVLAKRAKDLERGLNQIAAKAKVTAELEAKRGLVLNVYGTVEGAYRRTHVLELLVYSDATATGRQINVVLGDRAPYASEIEFGTGPSELTEPQLLAYMEAMVQPRLLRFGRSGKKYLLPGPYLLPALFITRYQTVAAVRRLANQLWA